MTEIDSPSGAQWEIAAAGHRAVVVEVGGGLREYTLNGTAVLDGYAADEVCPGCAGQVLVPWPNRIRDGRYTFAEQNHQLSLSEPVLHNAIHGLARWVRWRPVETAADAITVEYDIAAQPGYPWTLRLRTRYSVGPDGLRVDHEATNRSADPAPFGLGVHPYLMIPGVEVDDLVLKLPTQQRLLVDGRLLPMGAAKVTGGPFDFTEARRIGNARLDTAFGEVTLDDDGLARAVLESPDGSQTREVWADGTFGWWQVFTGDTLHGERLRRSVAMEPMTCPPDAFRSGRDVITIASGETWHGSWGIRATVG
ncbi:MAG TPA: aldose 1-epimerase family protein [Micromonosporaceae bacterium]|nr:aldose 1-epimerase family protein [Micromonosporaceae bacterium]